MVMEVLPSPKSSLTVTDILPSLNKQAGIYIRKYRLVLPAFLRYNSLLKGKSYVVYYRNVALG